MDFKKYINIITSIEKAFQNGNDDIILLLLSVERVDFNIEKIFKLQIRTIKALLKYAGYSLTPIKEISSQKETKETNSFQYNNQSNSLSINEKESQNIHQKLNELKEKHPYETESNMNQIIKSFKRFQAEIFDSESSKYIEKIEEIGNGQRNKFTKVLMNKFYTLKEINNEISKLQNIQRLIDEFNIMLTLHHPNILKVHGQFINEKNQQNPSILLEYCPFNLEQKIERGKLSKIQQVLWIYQIAEGMKYIHSRKINHQNLKPSNILVSETGMIKICDFEISGINETNSKTGEMEDVYAFGSIVFYILSGGKNKEKSNEIMTTLPLNARQLIDKCCSIQQECHPTFEMICDDLEKNEFNLISLSREEIQEVQKLIRQHKSLIINESQQ